MNEDSQLIYEAYLRESRIKSLVLTAMCMAGIGCATLDNNRPAREWEPASSDQNNINFLLDILKIIVDLFGGHVSLTPEQETQLQLDLEEALRSGQEPEEGWHQWVKNWKARNI